MSDIIEQVRAIVARMRHVANERTGTPGLIDGVNRCIDECASLAQRPGPLTDEEECAISLGIAQGRAILAYESLEIKKRHPAASVGGHTQWKDWALEAVHRCDDAKRLLKEEKARQLWRAICDGELDELQASMLSEAAFYAKQTGGPQAAIEFLNRAIELQPHNPKFRTNLASAYWEIERRETSRDAERCTKILEQLSEATRLGSYTTTGPLLETFLSLPQLPAEIRGRGEQLQRESLERLHAYREELAYYQQFLESRPGPALTFVLVQASVGQVGDYLRLMPHLQAVAEMPCLVARYRSAPEPAREARSVDDWVQLSCLAFECHLGLLGERVHLRMKSRRVPSQGPRDTGGPLWDVWGHKGVGILICLPAQGQAGGLLELEIVIAQLTDHPAMLRDPTWQSSYHNLLGKLLDGMYGYCAVLRAGSPTPFGVPPEASPPSPFPALEDGSRSIAVGEHRFDLKRVRVPDSTVSFLVPVSWRPKSKKQGTGTLIWWEDEGARQTLNLLFDESPGGQMAPPPPPYRVVAYREHDGVLAIEAILEQEGYSSRKLALTHSETDFYWTFLLPPGRESYDALWKEIISSVRVAEVDAELIAPEAGVGETGCLSLLGLLFAALCSVFR